MRTRRICIRKLAGPHWQCQWVLRRRVGPDIWSSISRKNHREQERDEIRNVSCSSGKYRFVPVHPKCSQCRTHPVNCPVTGKRLSETQLIWHNRDETPPIIVWRRRKLPVSLRHASGFDMALNRSDRSHHTSACIRRDQER